MEIPILRNCDSIGRLPLRFANLNKRFFFANLGNQTNAKYGPRYLINSLKLELILQLKFIYVYKINLNADPRLHP